MSLHIAAAYTPFQNSLIATVAHAEQSKANLEIAINDSKIKPIIFDVLIKYFRDELETESKILLDRIDKLIHYRSPSPIQELEILLLLNARTPFTRKMLERNISVPGIVAWILEYAGQDQDVADIFRNTMSKLVMLPGFQGVDRQKWFEREWRKRDTLDPQTCTNYAAEIKTNKEKIRRAVKEMKTLTLNNSTCSELRLKLTIINLQAKETPTQQPS